MSETWAAVGSGLCASAVAGFCGWLLVRRRLWRAAHPASNVQGFTERRQSVRSRGRSVEVCVTDVAGRNVIVRGSVYDRSLLGLGLRLDGRLPVRAAFRIEPITAHLRGTSLLVEIRHCRKVGRHYRVGCRFAQAPNWVTLSQFS